MKSDALVTLANISKESSDSFVLKDVSLDINRGEVHALVGVKGAGLYPLIKVLTGVSPKDSGTIWVDGEDVEINNRDEALKLGISGVYQQLSLIPTLNVTQNILLNRDKSILGILNKRAMRDEAEDIIRRYDFPLSPDDIIESLPVSKRRMVEIMKALANSARLLIMDEPTASLGSGESRMMINTVRQLRDQGVSILYLSDRLDEVFKVADRVTVLRGGRNIATVERKDIVPREIVQMITGGGQENASASLKPPASDQKTALRVNGLTREGYFSDISFELKKGEVLVLTGPLGSGRTALLRAIFGADPYEKGEIIYQGEKLPASTVKAARAGIGLVPHDSGSQGFAPLLSVKKNIAITNYDGISRFGVIDIEKEKGIGEKAIQMTGMEPKKEEAPVGSLTEENQEKVVLGKWLTRDLDVLLLDEPAAGIGKEAREKIFSMVYEQARKNVAVLMVLSDLDEVLRAAHRILVMRDGKLIREFNQGMVTREDILLVSSGVAVQESDKKEDPGESE